MANQTISQLPSAGPITGTELVPVVQNGGTYKTTAAALAGSPVQTQTFLTLNQEPTLNNSRYLSTDGNLNLTDGGAQSFLRINLIGASASLNTAGNGFAVKTGLDTVTPRTITVNTNGISIANGDGVSGNPVISLTGQVLSLANASGAGLVALPNNGTVTPRSIVGTASEIDVVDGDGAAGNPTIGIADNPVFPGTAGAVMPSGTTANRAGSPTNGTFRYNTTTQVFEGYANGSWGNFSPTGGVTSVGLSMPSQFTVTNSPVTTSGTLTASWNSQTANYVLASPDGTSGVPTFRALTNTDIPTALSGKTINSSVIGGVTPAAGTFTDLTSNFLQLNTAAAASIAIAKLRWNIDTATAAFGIIDGTQEVNIGQQMYALVHNADSVTITRGQPVYLYQASGDKASVKLAANLGDATSAKTLGLVVETIAAGGNGFVITQGVLDKVNTSAFAEGDTLYLGATAGTLTATKPKAPNHLVYIGVVERANAGNGQIYVRVQNGYELDEIHDVQINSPANGQTIIYDASTSLWKNANLTAGSGISITNGPASITIAATGGGGGGSVTSVDVSGGTTGLTTSGGPITTSGTITLAGTLITSNGGTGLTSYTAGDLPYYATGTALSKLGIGTSTYLLTSSGTAPQWSDPSGVTVGNAANVAVASDSTNANYYLGIYSNNTGNLPTKVAAGLTANPSTGMMTGGISGGTF